MTAAEEPTGITANIDRRGQRRRVILGIAATAVAAGGFWLTPPGLSRLWLFFPLAVALLCFAQAQQKT